MKVSIIIPCFNEVNTIQQIIDAVRASPLKDKEIIVIDDCSTDGTQKVLKDTIEKQVDQVIYHHENQGKGAALRTGFNMVSGEIVLIQICGLGI